MSNKLDLLVINYSVSTLTKALELFRYVFKYNYTAKVLDASDALIDTDKIINIVKLNRPNLICFIISQDIYGMASMLSISNYIANNIAEATVAYGINPANLRDVNMKKANFDFLCNNDKSLLDLLKFIGDKDIVGQSFNDIWYKDGDIFRKD